MYVNYIDYLIWECKYSSKSSKEIADEIFKNYWDTYYKYIYIIYKNDYSYFVSKYKNNGLFDIMIKYINLYRKYMNKTYICNVFDNPDISNICNISNIKIGKKEIYIKYNKHILDLNIYRKIITSIYVDSSITQINTECKTLYMRQYNNSFYYKSLKCILEESNKFSKSLKDPKNFECRNNYKIYTFNGKKYIKLLFFPFLTFSNFNIKNFGIINNIDMVKLKIDKKVNINSCNLRFEKCKSSNVNNFSRRSTNSANNVLIEMADISKEDYEFLRLNDEQIEIRNDSDIIIYNEPLHYF